MIIKLIIEIIWMFFIKFKIKQLLYFKIRNKFIKKKIKINACLINNIVSTFNLSFICITIKVTII